MSDTPTDAEIDEVTLDVLGYAALDKETNETARMIARAVLAKWAAPQPAPAPLSDDDLVELGKSEKSGLHPWGIGTTRADYLRAVRAVLDAARKQGGTNG
jgi:hypothetical protein